MRNTINWLKLQQARTSQLRDEDWQDATPVERSIVSAYQCLADSDRKALQERVVDSVQELIDSYTPDNTYLLAFQRSTADVLRHDLKARVKHLNDRVVGLILTPAVSGVSWDKIGRLYADFLIDRDE